MTLSDGVIEYLMGAIGTAFIAVFGWAWQINTRVTTNEVKQSATDAKIDLLRGDIKDVGEKIDRLLERRR